MALIGYVRVSIAEQNLDMQIDQLTAAGCEKIFLAATQSIQGTSIASDVIISRKTHRN